MAQRATMEASLQAARVSLTHRGWRLGFRLLTRWGRAQQVGLAMALATWRDRSDRATQREKLLQDIKKPGHKGDGILAARESPSTKVEGRREPQAARHPAEAQWEAWMRRG